MSELPPPVANADSAPYWRAAKEGWLALQKCGDCGHVDFMPRHLCPSCWSDRREHVRASGKGTVHSFSVIRRAPLPAFAAIVPYVVALIDLEEGPRMPANIVGDDALTAEIGAPVELTFEDRGEARLPQFRLAR